MDDRDSRDLHILLGRHEIWEGVGWEGASGRESTEERVKELNTELTSSQRMSGSRAVLGGGEGELMRLRQVGLGKTEK